MSKKTNKHFELDYYANHNYKEIILVKSSIRNICFLTIKALTTPSVSGSGSVAAREWGGGPIPCVDTSGNASISAAADAWCVLHNINPQSRSQAATLALTLDTRCVNSLNLFVHFTIK